MLLQDSCAGDMGDRGKQGLLRTVAASRSQLTVNSQSAPASRMMARTAQLRLQAELQNQEIR